MKDSLFYLIQTFHVSRRPGDVFWSKFFGFGWFSFSFSKQVIEHTNVCSALGRSRGADKEPWLSQKVLEYHDTLKLKDYSHFRDPVTGVTHCWKESPSPQTIDPG